MNKFLPSPINFFFVIIYSLLPNSLFSQTFEWVRTGGGINYDTGRSIAIDESGNVIMMGSFSEDLEFNTISGLITLTSSGTDNLFIQKLNSDGAILWVKSIGGSSIVRGNLISVDHSGNIYTTGFFSGTADFDPGIGTFNLTSNDNSQDVFVQKLDSLGNFGWVKTFGGDSFDHGRAITLDNLGNIYILGIYNGTVDFDPGAVVNNLTAIGWNDVFIQKMDSSGNFLWVKSFGANFSVSGTDISVDAIGNVYTTGYFDGTVDFDPGPGVSNKTSIEGGDVFVHKIDSLGNLSWVRTFGGNGDEYGLSIEVSDSGYVFTTGCFWDDGDFDPGLSMHNLVSNGGADVFVQKMDSFGNFIWAESFGSTGEDMGQSITIDNYDNIYMTGLFSDAVNFNTASGENELYSKGASDVFINKLDSSGGFLWAKSIGGVGRDDGRSVKVDDDGNIYSTGSFHHSVDFNPGINTFNLMSVGETDFYVHKMSDQTASLLGEIEKNLKVVVYPNPSTGVINIEFPQQKSSVKVILTDLSGKVVTSNMYLNTKLIYFELIGEKGVYLLTVDTQEGTETKKLIIE